jgi:hypothetical protein
MTRWTSFLCAVLLAGAASPAAAHTVQVCWRAEPGGRVTLLAGTYHADPGIHGGIVVDGVQHIFTGSVPRLPADVTGCQAACPGGAPAPQQWQTTTIAMPLDLHLVDLTSTSGIEAPWPDCYPALLPFGGETGDGDGGGGDGCDDGDHDGVCNDDDVCPGTVLPERVPTDELGTNRFADLDGDRIFDTRSPDGMGPGRTYTIAGTGGCSCEQIIEALGLGEGHRKHGCSIGAMDDWIAHLEAHRIGPYRAPSGAADAEVQVTGCAAGGSGDARLPGGALLAGAILLAARRRRPRG